MLLSYGWPGKKVVSASYTFNSCYSFILPQTASGIPASFLCRSEIRGRKGVGDKIEIITCVCVCVRTKECWIINYTSKTK